MEHVVLVIHLILTLALIVLILLQRSEGGGLGLGAGGGLGSFATAQSTANALTKATTFVAIGFFVTSIVLAILAAHNGGSSGSILDAAAVEEPAAVLSVGEEEKVPEVPVEGTSAPADRQQDIPAETPSEAPTVPIAE